MVSFREGKRFQSVFSPIALAIGVLTSSIGGFADFFGSMLV